VASRRVTNALRDEILKDLVEQATMKEIAAYNRLAGRVAKKVWMKLHTPAQRKLMEEAPDGAFHTRETFTVSIKIPGSHRVGKTRLDVGSAYCDTCYGSYRAAVKESHPVFACYSNGACVDAVADLDESLQKQILDLEEERKRISDKRVDLRQRIYTMLRGFNTVKQLEERWPEVMPFVQKHLPPEPLQLPDVKFSEMNELLGLSSNK